MIVLDTNVLSELMKPSPSKAVQRWVMAQSVSNLFTTTITQAELLYGIHILPQGARKQRLKAAVTELLEEYFAGKILPFGQTAAERFATISAHRRSVGNPISQLDAQIAAICSAYQASIATRNVKDFVDCQIDVIDPWIV